MQWLRRSFKRFIVGVAAEPQFAVTSFCPASISSQRTFRRQSNVRSLARSWVIRFGCLMCSAIVWSTLFFRLHIVPIGATMGSGVVKWNDRNRFAEFFKYAKVTTTKKVLVRDESDAGHLLRSVHKYYYGLNAMSASGPAALSIGVWIGPWIEYEKSWLWRRECVQLSLVLAFACVVSYKIRYSPHARVPI